MGTVLALVAFAGLVALNSALGYSFFSSGIVLASLTAVASGYGYALLVGRLNPNRKIAFPLLKLVVVLSLGIGFFGLQKVFSYGESVDPSQDPAAIQAAGETLFMLQAVGMGLALRRLRPRTALPELDEES